MSEYRDPYIDNKNLGFHFLQLLKPVGSQVLWECPKCFALVINPTSHLGWHDGH